MGADPLEGLSEAELGRALWMALHDCEGYWHDLARIYGFYISLEDAESILRVAMPYWERQARQRGYEWAKVNAWR